MANKKKKTEAKKKTPRSPGLSVIVPAYNEERRLGPTLTKIQQYFKTHRISYELIVVDDGSSDRTVDLVKKRMRVFKELRLIKNPGNQGKGAAVKNGVLAARGKRILFSDADLSTPVKEYQTLNRVMDMGADIVIGSRALQRELIVRHQPRHREIAGRFFNLMVRLFTLGGFMDTQCGFKMFTAKVGKKLFALQQVPKFGFDVEFLFLAVKFGFSVRECPVMWEDSPDTKVSLKEGLRTFWDLVRIRLLDMRGRYSA